MERRRLSVQERAAVISATLLSPSTVRNWEAGKRMHEANLARIELALRALQGPELARCGS